MIYKLIFDGQMVRTNCVQADTMGGHLVSGEEYAKWIYDCRIYLEEKFPQKSFTKDFAEESKNAMGNDVSHLDKMMGIIKAVSDAIDNQILEVVTEEVSL
jgi:hypothetical protein